MVCYGIIRRVFIQLREGQNMKLNFVLDYITKDGKQQARYLQLGAGINLIIISKHFAAIENKETGERAELITIHLAKSKKSALQTVNAWNETSKEEGRYFYTE